MLNNQRGTLEQELLDSLCEKHGIRADLILELIDIEKEHQFQQRRHGIYLELKECLQNSLSPEERKD